MFVKLLTVITSPSKFVQVHMWGESFIQAPVQGTRKGRGANVADDIFVQVSPGSSSPITDEGKKKYRGEDVCKFFSFFRYFFFPWISGETIGIMNVSEECNWDSLMCCCGCCVLSVNCHPAAQGSLTKARSSQAVKFSTGA